MQLLAMDLRMLSRELSLYLEHQVRVGFSGSGVGFSLILGFSVAYACLYLSSIAKVSRGVARAPRRRATGGKAGSPRHGPSWGRAGCFPCPASAERPWSAREAGQPLSARLWSGPGPPTAARTFDLRAALPCRCYLPSKALGNAVALFRMPNCTPRLSPGGV